LHGLLYLSCSILNKVEAAVKLNQFTFIHHTKNYFMPLLTILLVLVVVGVVLWLINTYIPMDRKIKNILNIVVVIVVILWLLKAFGLLDGLKSIRV
jgi:hypothetical protein